MSERFYGPWRIELNAPVINALGFRRARLGITGSVGADGIHELPEPVDQPNAFTLDIDGPEWKLEVLIFNSHFGYRAVGTRRTTGFDRVDGFVAVIEAGRAPTSEQRSSLYYVRLRCFSEDPAVSPGQSLDLYDFSLPRR